MNPAHLTSECSDYGAHQSPDYPVLFGWTLVAIGLGFCLFKVFV